MIKRIISITVVSTLLITAKAHANQAKNDTVIFQQLFSDWTEAFNQKDLSRSCALFSKKVVANYQGVPEKNYSSICDGFKKIFEEKDKRYQYRFKLHHVYRSNTLAAVRITWYLNISENDKPISEVQDEGIDIFEKNEQGQWEIVNYIAFPNA